MDAATKSERRGTRVKGEPGRQTSIFLGFHPRLQPGRLKANSLISGLHCNPMGSKLLTLNAAQADTMERKEYVRNEIEL